MRLSMVKKLLTLSLFCILMMPLSVFAQNASVRGKVTDGSTGEILPGANVVLTELSIGASSDIDGNYEIKNVPSGSYSLKVSFVGYKHYSASVTITSVDVVIDITLTPDFLGLEEVYVTAYGIEKTKNELSYAAQKVDGDEIAKVATGNFINVLSGRVAGVDIKQNNSMGGSTNIVIRGYKSLTGNNQALFVVDGVPYDNANTNSGGQQSGRIGYDYGSAAADMNPDDIASINVLKGPAASALYGSRAANGVVVITTKKGKKGQTVGVTVNSGLQVGIIDKSTFINYQKEYGAGYGPFYSGGAHPGLEEMDVDGDNVDDLVVPTYEDASYGEKFDSSLLVYQWDAFDPTSPNYKKKTPWINAKNDPSSFFETAITWNNSVFIDGGSTKGYFKLGYNNIRETGILPNSEIAKNMINFSANYEITKDLTATAAVNVTKTAANGRYGTGYGSINLMTNFRQWWQTNVDVSAQKDAYFRNKVNASWNWDDNTSIGSSMPGAIYWDNPYFTRYENYQNDSRDRYFSNMSVNYKAFDWLSFTGRVALDSYDEFQEERFAVGSIDVAQYTRYNRSFREVNYDFLANFNKKISDDLSVSGLLGTNIRRAKTTSIFASTNGGLVIPRLYSIANSLNPISAPGEFEGEVGVDGYFGNFSANFKNFLVLDMSLRRDQSSTLPDNANTFYYPSISGGFVFSELLGTTGFLDYGKVRLNYAEVGNTAPIYSIKDDYDKPNPWGSVPIFSVPGTKKNSTLKPERTSSLEAGLEATFLKGMIGFDFTYYQSSTIDQIIPVSITTATGFNSKYVNAGEVANKGMEVSIFTKPIATKDFIWNLDFNWSKNTNEVISLAPGITNLQIASLQGGVSINAAIGEPFGTIRGSNYKYDSNGNKIVGANGFYTKTSTSNEIIGDMNPDWLGSVSNRFQYKSFAASFLIDIRSGGDIFSLDQYYGQGTGMTANTVGNNDLGNPQRSPLLQTGNQATGWVSNPASGGVILPGVLADGTTNTRRVAADNNGGPYGWARNPAAGFVYDGSYVKLREVTLSYSLPSDLLKSVPALNGVEVSVIGRNLWIISKNMPDADPEEQFSSGNISGYQGGAYPTTRTFALNFKLKF